MFMGNAVLLCCVPTWMRVRLYHQAAEAKVAEDGHKGSDAGENAKKLLQSQVEYRALRLQLRVVLTYWFTIQFISFMISTPITARSNSSDHTPLTLNVDPR